MNGKHTLVLFIDRAPHAAVSARIVARETLPAAAIPSGSLHIYKARTNTYAYMKLI